MCRGFLFSPASHEAPHALFHRGGFSFLNIIICPGTVTVERPFRADEMVEQALLKCVFLTKPQGNMGGTDFWGLIC